MKLDSNEFMANFRWITPLLVTILIFFVTQLATEIRALREEISEARKFSVAYTDKMIELIIKTGEKKR